MSGSPRSRCPADGSASTQTAARGIPTKQSATRMGGMKTPRWSRSVPGRAHARSRCRAIRSASPHPARSPASPARNVTSTVQALRRVTSRAGSARRARSNARPAGAPSISKTAPKHRALALAGAASSAGTGLHASAVRPVAVPAREPVVDRPQSGRPNTLICRGFFRSCRRRPIGRVSSLDDCLAISKVRDS